MSVAIESESSAKSSHINGIDGLRAVAVLSVLLSHWVPGYVYLYNWGTAGVYLFFFISGYVITKGLLSEEKKKGKINVGNFYGRRALRIWPIYFLSILFITFVWPAQEVHGIWWHVLFLSNILFSLDGALHFPVHYWTLSVEQQFYLLWPLAFTLSGKRVRIIICVLFIILGPISRAFFFSEHNIVAAMYLPTSNFDCISAGALLALLESDKKLIEKSRIYLMAAFALLFIPLLYLSYINIKQPINVLGPVAISFIAMYLISGMKSGRTIPVITSLPMVFIGKISYGIYLYHLFVGYYLYPYLGESYPWYVFFFASTVATISLSTMSWYLIERPLIEISKKKFR